MTPPAARALAPLLALALVLAGCGDDDDDGSGAAATEETEPAADEEAPAPSTSAPPSSAPEETPPAPDADRVIEVRVEGGSVTGGGRQEVAVGDTVALVITADVADEVHVHGYDLTADLVPGEPATVTFDATLAGVWEVELHDAGTVLVELQVS